MKTPSTAQEWSPVVADWRASGLSAAKFCRRQGLSQWTFRYWRKKAEAAGTGRLRRPTLPPSAAGVSFVEARLVESGPTPIEVRLAGGRSLRVRGDFDEGVLRKLVAALEALQ